MGFTVGLNSAHGEPRPYGSKFWAGQAQPLREHKSEIGGVV